MKASIRLLILIGIAIAMVASPLAGSTAVTKSKVKIIRACVSKTNGSIRIIGPWRHCPPGQRMVTWNRSGSKGPTGQSVAGQTGPQGPQGATGTTGAPGATGPRGTTGDTGATGAAGKTVLSGSGAPSLVLGATGDFYLDTTANAIYGPKAGSGWGSGVSLIGPKGEKGDPGTPGADGAKGDKGDPGAAGAAGANLARQILFSTGSNNLQTGNYVGIADAEASETTNQDPRQIVAIGGHITAMYCHAAVARTASTTYTLRINSADTAATCTIAFGDHVGSTTGLNVALSAGDLLDVFSPAANGSGKGNFAVTVGP